MSSHNPDPPDNGPTERRAVPFGNAALDAGLALRDVREAASLRATRPQAGRLCGGKERFALRWRVDVELACAGGSWWRATCAVTSMRSARRVTVRTSACSFRRRAVVARFCSTLEAFSKKTQKTPPAKIALAERRLTDWRARGQLSHR